MNTIPFGPRNEDPLLVERRGTSEGGHAAAGSLAFDRRAARGRRKHAKPRAFSGGAALAAGFVVASVSALLTWGLMRGAGPAVQRPVAAATRPVRRSCRSITGPTPVSRPGELVARETQLVQFREKLGQLRPETREAIVRNLAVIQAAADEIDAALRRIRAERDG